MGRSILLFISSNLPLTVQYHENLLLSQCYCVVDSTIVPLSINVRFVTINVCVAVRSFVLIVSDIAIIRFDSANPPGYFRKVFASCLFLTSQRQGLYPWVPPRLQRLSQSTSCRSNSVTHHHSLEIEDCVLFWLPRTNFIGFFMRLCRGLVYLVFSHIFSRFCNGPSFRVSSCNSGGVFV